MAARGPNSGRKGKEAAAAPPTPSQIAFQGRVQAPNANGIVDVQSRDPAIGVSQYPHQTPAVAGARGTHITSSRFVHEQQVNIGDKDVPVRIHERYSQDDVAGAQPVHDRFFATLPGGGMVKAAAEFRDDMHQSKHATVPRRADPIREPPQRGAKLQIMV